MPREAIFGIGLVLVFCCTLLSPPLGCGVFCIFLAFLAWEAFRGNPG